MWKIIKRSFEACKYPKGSPQRNKLNRSSLTSEFAKHKRYIVTLNNKPKLSFPTYSSAKNFIDDTYKEKYKPDKKIKKYNRQRFINTQNYFNKKRNIYKFK